MVHFLNENESIDFSEMSTFLSNRQLVKAWGINIVNSLENSLKRLRKRSSIFGLKYPLVAQ